jgi:hypothetical protein
MFLYNIINNTKCNLNVRIMTTIVENYICNTKTLKETKLHSYAKNPKIYKKIHAK